MELGNTAGRQRCGNSTHIFLHPLLSNTKIAAVSLLPTTLTPTTTDPEALGIDHTGKVLLWRPQRCSILHLTTKPNNPRTRPAIPAQLLAQICPASSPPWSPGGGPKRASLSGSRCRRYKRSYQARSRPRLRSHHLSRHRSKAHRACRRPSHLPRHLGRSPICHLRRNILRRERYTTRHHSPRGASRWPHFRTPPGPHYPVGHRGSRQ